MTNVLQIQNGQTSSLSYRDSFRVDNLISRASASFQIAIANMPLLEETPAFTGQPETHTFAGLLFDMDGIIVDSTDAIVKHWHKFVFPSKIIGFSGRCSSL